MQQDGTDIPISLVGHMTCRAPFWYMYASNRKADRENIGTGIGTWFFRKFTLYIDKVSIWYSMQTVSSFSGVAPTNVILVPKNDPAFSQGFFYLILFFFDVSSRSSHDWTT